MCKAAKCAAGTCMSTTETAKIGTACRPSEDCREFVCDASGQCSTKNLPDNSVCKQSGELHYLCAGVRVRVRVCVSVCSRSCVIR